MAASSDEDDVEMEEVERVPSQRSVSEPRRRGRPPTTGDYVDLAKAKEDLLRLEREELRLRAEWEVLALDAEARRTRAMAGAEPRARGAPDEEALGDGPLTCTLIDRVQADIKLMGEVAVKSSNLKGTYVRALKDAASTLKRKIC